MTSSLTTELATGTLIGCGEIVRARRTVGDLNGFWADAEAAKAQAEQPLYETEAYFPAPDGTEGAVLWGSTRLFPGKVGNEYFMTRGHWHLKPTHGELIVVTAGTGLLQLMDRDRNCTFVDLAPGVTFYIDGTLAHRTINNGSEILVFWCSWPADCGHDYQSILRDGFSERVLAS